MRAMDLEQTRLPEKIGEYQRMRLIGRGGMGEVWLATKPGLAKPVALKVLLPQYSRNPDYRTRFFREAKILATLRHGRIVTVLEFGEDRGHLFIAMEYIDGVNLSTLCEALSNVGRRLPVTVVGYVIGEVFEALRHAHNRTIGGVLRGVIHRDVTPDNVMISSEGEVFLSDFGIARFGAEGSREMFGKFQYMAPEQGLGEATYRSDIYSACGVLHYMLTGEPPRLVYNLGEFQQQIAPEIRSTRRDDVPEPLERLRVSGLQADPKDRLASAKDALLLLEAWLGYRKVTTTLAEIHTHLIGPARSGMTDIVPAAVAPRWKSPSPPPAGGSRTGGGAPTLVVSPAAVESGAVEARDSDDAPGSWRRRWWSKSGEGTGGGAETEQLTTRFVEADAPRLFRRRRAAEPVPPPAPSEEASPTVTATEVLPPAVEPSPVSASDPTPWLGASTPRAVEEERTAKAATSVAAAPAAAASDVAVVSSVVLEPRARASVPRHRAPTWFWVVTALLSLAFVAGLLRYCIFYWDQPEPPTAGEPQR